MSTREELFERERSKYFTELQGMFSECERLVIDFEEYCKVNCVEHPVDHMRWVVRMMDLMMGLKNLEYYRESLALKRRELEFRVKNSY